MFFLWFAVAVVVIGLLSVLGAFISRRAPGTDWEKHEDRPLIGPGEH